MCNVLAKSLRNDRYSKTSINTKRSIFSGKSLSHIQTGYIIKVPHHWNKISVRGRMVPETDFWTPADAS